MNRKSLTLEAQLRFRIMKRYLESGMQDKTQAIIDMISLKNSNEKRIYFLGNSLPLASKILKNDKDMAEICTSIDTQFRNSLQRLIKKNSTIDIDCSICFHNFSNDNNPIIYCSGYVI